MCWHTPAHFAPGDVEMDIAGSVLAGGRNSRLYRRLVYEMEIAQDVFAFQGSQALGSQFCIISTARPGRNLGELEAVIQEELDRLRTSPPTTREIARVVNQTEAGFLDRLEQIGGFGGKADQLNAYYFQTGNPDYFNEDLSRYKAITPSDIRAAVGRWLGDNNRVILSIVPQGRPELAAPARTTME
jgi:zinc protease